MVEGCSFTGVARLAVIVFTRQTASMTVGTGKTVTFYAHHIVVLRFGRTYTAGSRPEGVVMTGRTGLWHEGVMTALAVIYRCSQYHVVVLTHRRIATGGSPEARIVTELTAVHSRNVCRSTVTNAAGKVQRDGWIILVVVLLHTQIARRVTAVTAAVKDHCRVTGVTVNTRIDIERMVSIACGQLVVIGIKAPVGCVVAGSTTRNIAGIRVAGITGEVGICDRHIMVLLLVGFARSVAILTVRYRGLNVHINCVVAVAAGQRPTEQRVVAISGFTLVTIMAVERARSVGVTGCTISLSGGRSVVNLLGGLASPVIGRVVAAFTVNNLWHLRMAILTADTASAGCSVVGILYVTTVATDAAGQRLHSCMTRGAIDRVGGIVCSSVVRSTDTTLVTSETITEVAYVGMALGTVTGRRIRSIMVCILLRNKRMTACTVTICRNTFMTLVTQTL
jgi:hypothetical protein